MQIQLLTSNVTETKAIIQSIEEEKHNIEAKYEDANHKINELKEEK